MQRPSPRFRSQQFFLSKICGEIFYPDLYGDAMLVPIQMDINMVAENQQKHLSLSFATQVGVNLSPEELKIFKIMFFLMHELFR